ncbi:MAG: ABC transporter ATP-binding protein [Bacillota bacterium]|nr:MAG: ABC transporter ATP-binding protein [Bacillota bacterium]
MKLQAYLAKESKKIQTLEEKIKKIQSKIALNTSKIELDGVTDHDLLVLKNLTMRFGGLVAVNDLSFTVKKGEIFGLIGPNGAGKTTVFNCITQFYKPTSGDIYYLNRIHEFINLNDYKVHNVIKEGIARTFQNVEMVWELSVLDNMLVGSHSKFNTGFFSHLIHSKQLKREENVLRAKAIDILKKLGIEAYMHYYPFGLPYGILKKIELARTLMTNPSLIILDEPAAGLNDLETKELAKTIKQIQKEYNCTIFLVEHDMGLVMDICDTICAISFGKKLAIGTPKEIQANKDVQTAYLGGE